MREHGDEESLSLQALVLYVLLATTDATIPARSPHVALQSPTPRWIISPVQVRGPPGDVFVKTPGPVSVLQLAHLVGL